MAKLNSQFKHMYDAAPSIALLPRSAGAQTATFTGAAYALDKLDGYWNDAGELADMELQIVANVTAVDHTTGDETYKLTIEASTDAAFTTPVEVAVLAAKVPSTGQYAVELDVDTVRQTLPGVGYIRLKGTLAGTTPSITAYAWIGGC